MNQLQEKDQKTVQQWLDLIRTNSWQTKYKPHPKSILHKTEGKSDEFGIQIVNEYHAYCEPCEDHIYSTTNPNDPQSYVFQHANSERHKTLLKSHNLPEIFTEKNNSVACLVCHCDVSKTKFKKFESLDVRIMNHVMNSDHRDRTFIWTDPNMCLLVSLAHSVPFLSYLKGSSCEICFVPVNNKATHVKSFSHLLTVSKYLQTCFYLSPEQLLSDETLTYLMVEMMKWMRDAAMDPELKIETQNYEEIPDGEEVYLRPLEKIPEVVQKEEAAGGSEGDMKLQLTKAINIISDLLKSQEDTGASHHQSTTAELIQPKKTSPKPPKTLVFPATENSQAIDQSADCNQSSAPSSKSKIGSNILPEKTSSPLLTSNATKLKTTLKEASSNANNIPPFISATKSASPISNAPKKTIVETRNTNQEAVNNSPPATSTVKYASPAISTVNNIPPVISTVNNIPSSIPPAKSSSSHPKVADTSGQATQSASLKSTTAKNSRKLIDIDTWLINYVGFGVSDGLPHVPHPQLMERKHTKPVINQIIGIFHRFIDILSYYHAYCVACGVHLYGFANPDDFDSFAHYSTHFNSPLHLRYEISFDTKKDMLVWKNKKLYCLACNHNVMADELHDMLPLERLIRFHTALPGHTKNCVLLRDYLKVWLIDNQSYFADLDPSKSVQVKKSTENAIKKLDSYVQATESASLDNNQSLPVVAEQKNSQKVLEKALSNASLTQAEKVENSPGKLQKAAESPVEPLQNGKAKTAYNLPIAQMVAHRNTGMNVQDMRLKFPQEYLDFVTGSHVYCGMCDLHIYSSISVNDIFSQYATHMKNVRHVVLMRRLARRNELAPDQPLLKVVIPRKTAFCEVCQINVNADEPIRPARSLQEFVTEHIQLMH